MAEPLGIGCPFEFTYSFVGLSFVLITFVLALKLSLVEWNGIPPPQSTKASGPANMAAHSGVVVLPLGAPLSWVIPLA